MFDDRALAEQIATRLRAEGARDVMVTGNHVAFRGIGRADRPDLSRMNPMRLVREANFVVGQTAGGIEISPSIRQNWRNPAVIGLGIGLLVPLAFVHPTGAAAATALGIIVAVVAGQFGVARYQLSSWLRTLARQELGFLERHQIAGPEAPEQ